MIAMIAVTLSVILFFRPTPTPPTEVEHDSAATRDPGAAFLVAESLMTAGRFGEAVPYYRGAIRGEGSANWIPHAGLAMALRMCSVRRSTFGVEKLLLRSSWEGVAAGHEALSEMATATRFAHQPDELSAIAQIEGQLLEDWGLNHEALEVYQRAQPLDASGACARRAAILTALLRSPVVP